MRRLVIAAGLLVSSLPAWAQQEQYRHGFVRFVEPTVTIQRAEEPGAEAAEAQLPFLPGDRIWTDASGRVEFQFADGSLVRLDCRGKLDYVAFDEDSGRTVLRLWSGGLFLRSREGRGTGAFEIETPGGLVRPTEPGLIRLDVASGETRLSVHEGEAVLSSGRQEARVRAGERAYAQASGASEQAQPFDRWAQDDFDRWNGQREAEARWAGSGRRGLPQEVAPFEPELERHGSWYFEAGVGQVWRPYVASTWRPYMDGRWIWSAYGWTWVPHESWGWATSHYGSWGFSGSFGWYWSPGAVWSPAWVSWSVSGGYVGWCPRGRHGRPVEVSHYDRGHAVPRGGSGGGWTFARREHIGSRDRTLRYLDAAGAPGGSLQVLDPDRTRLSRDLRPVDASHAVARTVRTRPTIGDSVPELRTDPMTTIPAPVARRKRPGSDDRVGEQTLRPDGMGAAAHQRQDAESSFAEARRGGAGAVPAGDGRAQSGRASESRQSGTVSSDSGAVARERVRRFIWGESNGGATAPGAVRPSDGRGAPRPRSQPADVSSEAVPLREGSARPESAARRSWVETMRSAGERARASDNRGTEPRAEGRRDDASIGGARSGREVLGRLFGSPAARSGGNDAGSSAQPRSGSQSSHISQPSVETPRSRPSSGEVRSHRSASESSPPAVRSESQSRSSGAAGSSEGHAVRRPRRDRD
jgi:hypothetical protein